MLIFPNEQKTLIYHQINGVVSLQEISDESNGVVSLKEVPEEDSKPAEEPTPAPSEGEPKEGGEGAGEAPKEEGPPPVEEMHVEDYVMLHEGAVLKLIIIGYIGLEVSVFILLVVFSYIKIRLQTEKMSWDITGFFMEMKSYEYYKQKIDDIKNNRTQEDEDTGPVLNDEELLREEFRTAANESYATDNFRKF